MNNKKRDDREEIDSLDEISTEQKIKEIRDDYKDLRKKQKELEYKVEKTWMEGIKSLGRISIIISLGLTAIVTLIGVVQNKESFGFLEFFAIVVTIFFLMIAFFLICTFFIFKMLRKEKNK